MQTITVTHSPRGYRLNTPLTLNVPEPQNAADEKLQQYVIDSLSWKMPSLVSFTFNNASALQLAKHLLRHRTGSTATLYQYIYGVHRFSQWTNTEPDQIIQSCQDQDGDPNPKAIAKYTRLLDDFIGNLQAEGLAPGTVSNHVKGVKCLFRCSGLKLDLAYTLSKRTVYSDRAPTPEELQHIIDMADLREKVIISMLALAGFRIGTLIKLQYRHVKRDLEKLVTPIHIHVEAEITKGKYHDYDTFIGQEAAEYLRAYLEQRRQGSPTGRTPPEVIHDESPLIRDEHSKVVKPLTPSQVYNILHRLMAQAGLLGSKVGRRHAMRPHSIRKFFRTQMAALGVQTDYIEYMMGHTISRYHDIQMKGIEFLRGIYAASGLSIRPKTKPSRIEILKEMVRALGLNPEEILTKEALTMPHRTVITAGMEADQNQINMLVNALKQKLKQEITAEVPNATLKTV